MSWEELVTVALLGTERRRPELSGWPGGLGEAAAGLEGEPPEIVLDAAALATAYRRAGALPVTGVEPGEPAPDDAALGVPRLAAHRLTALLDSGDRELLAEWLTAVAGHGLRIPHRHLPAVLRAARRGEVPSEAVAAAAGERGRWLAALNPEWAGLFAAEPEPEPATWETGTAAQRTAWLAATRRRDPAAARATLERTWASEPVRDRAEFVALLAEGLAPDDEPLLERALDDRPPVREAAAALLARLPGSAFAGRMTGRARARLGLGGGRIGVLSVPADEEFARDGLGGAGEGRQLAAALGATPLTVWDELLGGPDAAVAAPVQEGWLDVVHGGWAAAAIRQGDARWAHALARAGTLRPEAERALLPVLPPADRAALVAIALARDPRPDSTRAAELLRGCPAPWDAALWRAVAGWVETASAEGRAWEPRPVLRLARHRLPPRAADTVAAFADTIHLDVVRLDLAALADTLTTRARMHEELR